MHVCGVWCVVSLLCPLSLSHAEGDSDPQDAVDTFGGSPFGAVPLDHSRLYFRFNPSLLFPRSLSDSSQPLVLCPLPYPIPPKPSLSHLLLRPPLQSSQADKSFGFEVDKPLV